MKKQKLPFDILDSIRGIAALYVTIAHCRGSLWMGGNEFMRQTPMEAWSVIDYMTFGTSLLTRLAVEFVIVFFLLSGFSIAHSLSENRSALPFYKRRLVRIYPSYLVALLWAALIFIATKALFPQWYDGSYTEFSFIRTMQMNDFFDWPTIVGNLFYVPGQGFISPFWSLTFEVIFYLFAPFLLRKPVMYITVSLFLFLLNLVAGTWLLKLPVHQIIYDFVFIYNFYFAAGVFLYMNWDSVINIAKPVARKAFLLVLGIVLGTTYLVNFWMGTETEYSFMMAGLLGFLLIVYFIRYNVQIKWLMVVGKFSYTLYITHLATIFLYLALYWLITGYRKEYIESFFRLVGRYSLMFIDCLSAILVSRRPHKNATESYAGEFF